MKLYLLALVCCYVSSESLHREMTRDELAYYFQTEDENSIPDYEVVELPVVLPVKRVEDMFGDSFEEVEYNFEAFRQPIELKLRKNQAITSPIFKTYLHEQDGVRVLDASPNDCHYLHRDGNIVASISFCSPKNVQGLVHLDNSTIEVHPLTERLHSLRRRPFRFSTGDLANTTVPHLIKRAHFKPGFEAFPVAGSVWDRNEDHVNGYNVNGYNVNGYNEIGIWDNLVETDFRASRRLTLELAVFFDEAAYQIFAPHYNRDDGKLRDMLLAYINGVQALYHHPSLGASLDLVIVRLDIMKRQPTQLPHHDGERGQLLDSFCSYQEGLNPEGDSDPEHWDMGLYVSGLDFYAYEKGRKSGVTMGLATVGGVCLDQYACVIAEFGTTNVFGKPYPSAGFTSVYIMAHEIGHNLGMHHDGSSNNCPKEGYIMSPSRGTNGETLWSGCSAEVMAKMGWAKCLQDTSAPIKHGDHDKFLDVPGQAYTAKKQCELLLRDRDAMMLPHQDVTTICYNLQCKTPHRSGYYFAGPALDGTQCGKGKYCYGGSCVKNSLPKPVKATPGGWGPWKEGTCSSGCIDKSMGHLTRKRFCNNPTPVNTDQGCSGSSIEFALCDDKKLCTSKRERESAVDYASRKCGEFSKLLKDLDEEGVGLQAPHEEARIWMGCAIFCKRSDSSGTFYTPRIELNDLGVSPYFPDGTRCHSDAHGNEYYCIQHHCLPETFKFSKSDDVPEEELLQNASPHPRVPEDLRDYLSLGADGKPVRTTLDVGEAVPRDEEWESKDYVEIGEMKGERFNFI